MVSNVVEVKARGAYVIGLAYEGDQLDSSVFDKSYNNTKSIK